MKGGQQRTGARSGGRGRKRHISVRAIDREDVDVQKLGRALIALLRAEAEAEAGAQAKTRSASEEPRTPPRGGIRD